MPDGKLILIKHAMPTIVPDAPPQTWRLSDDGRRRAAQLAEKLRGHDPIIVVTSDEPKAAETGEIIAARLGVPVKGAPGLHEHERGVVPFQSVDVFHTRVERLFAEPSSVVYGIETADDAHARFTAAVTAVLAAHPAGTVAIASHGTVISLLVARANGLDPFPLWKSLDLPSFLVLERGTIAVRDGGP
jgi:broad specificity phosphatase PhoE